MHKSKNIVHINTKAKRSQTSCLQEVWPFYSLTSVKDGIVSNFFVKINLSLFLKAFRRFRGKKYFYIFVDCAVKNSNLVFEIWGRDSGSFEIGYFPNKNMISCIAP